MVKTTVEEASLSILLVEQDINWGRFLQSYLEHKGMNIHLVMDGQDAWQQMLKGKYNFCILNPGISEMDGCRLAEQIRKQSAHVPIVFVASDQQDSEDLRIRCFKAGADDFVARPCSVEEILLRIKTIQKRFRFCPIDEYRVFDLGKLHFDHAKHRIYNRNFNIRLTTKEADLLLALCLHRGQVLEREEALLAVWKSKELYNVRSMDVYISKLRRLLYDYTYSEIINIHGVGFKLITHRDAEFRNELRRDAGILRKLPRRHPHPRTIPLTAVTANDGLNAEVAEALLREPDEALRKQEAVLQEPDAQGAYLPPAKLGKPADAVLPDHATAVAPTATVPPEAASAPADDGLPGQRP